MMKKAVKRISPNMMAKFYVNELGILGAARQCCEMMLNYEDDREYYMDVLLCLENQDLDED